VTTGNGKICAKNGCIAIFGCACWHFDAVSHSLKYILAFLVWRSGCYLWLSVDVAFICRHCIWARRDKKKLVLRVEVKYYLGYVWSIRLFEPTWAENFASFRMRLTTRITNFRCNDRRLGCCALFIFTKSRVTVQSECGPFSNEPKTNLEAGPIICRATQENICKFNFCPDVYNTVFIKECDKRTNFKERNKKRNRSNVKKLLKNFK